MNYTNEENTSKRKRAIIILLVLVLLAAIVFTVKSCIDRKGVELSGGSGITYDANATLGGWEGGDTDEIVETLNRQVQAGMINISMNTTPVFSDGTSKGNLMIVNEGVNLYPQVVEITRNDTGETIYTSGAIPVGSKIGQDTLDVVLPAGNYECTALFSSVDPDSGAVIGCAGAIITITVLE
jgi:hypothetical protein